MAEKNTNQNFLIVWVDANINPSKGDYQDAIAKLREVSNTVYTFTNVDECIGFVADITNKKVFMISSGAIGQTIVPLVHDMAQISGIYVYCGDKTYHEQWAQQWPKVKGIFIDIKQICEDLKKVDQESDQNIVSKSFVGACDDAADKNQDQLDPSFMYTQILKEVLLSINFESQQFMEFINYCREQFAGNPTELANVNKLEHEYRQHTPIWWYTNNCFLYSMVNSALRIMDVDHIIKLGFFIRDLHEQITRLYSEQSAGHHPSNTFVVYHAQGLSQADFKQLIKTQGGLFAFNNFLLTSKNRQGSLKFARETMENSDNMGILFVMTVDPFIRSVPFADIRNVSYHQNEEEILFSMHSVFRIGQIKKIDENNRLWQVDLTLTTDNDCVLQILTESIRQETFTDENGWYRLGNVLIKLGQFDIAQQIFEMKSTQTTDDGEKANTYLKLGFIKENLGEYTEALAFYTQAVEIKQKILPPNHPDLATSYKKIGSVYENMGKYSEALSSHENALKIYQNCLPPNHPDLATSYNNLGSLYDKIGEYSKALSSLEKALEIYQKSLPPNHPDLAGSYSNIGSAYEKMGDYSKAISSLEKALKIYQDCLPPNHPDLATSYNNLGSVYDKIGEYSKALSSLEKALEIYQKSLPPNHPDLATSYKKIGSVYENMGEHLKALSFYERA